ncbi:beta-glucosidase [Erwinia sp. SLM-02]|uniref:beta-glucosidase n=1 Tax=Erwinia sp. SLM-02 TaxID=3020057 RepID=UPI00307FD2FC
MCDDTRTSRSRHHPRLFQGFFQGSFPCSGACRSPGKRADLMINSGHDTLMDKDYALLTEHQLLTARDGARWYLIETSPGEYCWDSFLPQLRAAKKNNIEMIWELAHFGWPDGLDIWQPEFVERFAAFASAFARLLRDEGECRPLISPMNQISFWSWAGAEIAWFNPFDTGRGRELKQQLAQAAIAAMHGIRHELPEARFVITDPLVHVAASGYSGTAKSSARQQHEAQFEVWDWISGRSQPELGGSEDLLNIIGVTWYPDHQWFHNGDPLEPHHPDYRPLNLLLQDLAQRYARPILLAETGAEVGKCAEWLNLVCDEVRKALERGVEVEGLSIYPLVDYPSWDDDRRSPAGLFGLPDANGNRTVNEACALALRSQQIKFKQDQDREE